MLNKMELTYVIENDVLSITVWMRNELRFIPNLPCHRFGHTYSKFHEATKTVWQEHWCCLPNDSAKCGRASCSCLDDRLGTGPANGNSPSSMNPNVLGQYHHGGTGRLV